MLSVREAGENLDRRAGVDTGPLEKCFCHVVGGRVLGRGRLGPPDLLDLMRGDRGNHLFLTGEKPGKLGVVFESTRGTGVKVERHEPSTRMHEPDCQK